MRVCTVCSACTWAEKYPYVSHQMHGSILLFNSLSLSLSLSHTQYTHSLAHWKCNHQLIRMVPKFELTEWMEFVVWKRALSLSMQIVGKSYRLTWFLTSTSMCVCSCRKRCVNQFLSRITEKSVKISQ